MKQQLESLNWYSEWIIEPRQEYGAVRRFLALAFVLRWIKQGRIEVKKSLPRKNVLTFEGVEVGV